jgi:hypothetical protein
MKVQVKQTSPYNVNVGGSTAAINVAVQPSGPQGPQGVPGPVGPSGTAQLILSQALDVDVSGITNGALLVFSDATQKWEAGTMLEDQYIEGGQY